MDTLNNRRGIWIMVNDADKKIWIGASQNMANGLRLKASAVKSAQNGKITDAYKSTMPEKLLKNIEEVNGKVITSMYFLSTEDNELLRFAKINFPKDNPQKKAIVLAKLYTRYILFKDHTLYASESWFSNNRGFSQFYEDKLEEVSNYTKLYKINMRIWEQEDAFEPIEVSRPVVPVEYRVKHEHNTENELDKLNIIEEVTKEIKEDIEYVNDVIEDIESSQEEVEVVLEDDTLTSDILNAMLEIEAILKDTTVEKLIESLISNKTKQLYYSISEIVKK